MSAEIFDVIRSGSAERLREILKADPGQASARNERGHSAVLIAQYHRKKEMVEMLLAAEPELNVFDAASVGRADQVRSLLDADPSRVEGWSSDGFTPLHLAAFFGYPKVVELLLARGAGVNPVARNPMKVQPLHSAAAGHHGAVARLLVEAGADVNARQEKGWTPLHAAAQTGDLEMVQLFLDRGADPMAQSDEGKSAIGIAGEAGNTELLKVLKARKPRG
jgi:ankyrin repeat protein